VAEDCLECGDEGGDRMNIEQHQIVNLVTRIAELEAENAELKAQLPESVIDYEAMSDRNERAERIASHRRFHNGYHPTDYNT